MSDTAFRPLADVKVEMVDGPQADGSTTTSSTGQFSFSGTFTGTITVRATKAGYADAQHTVDVSADARRRTHQALLEDIGVHYLLIDVTGGGFAQQTLMGELFSGQLRIAWEESDEMVSEPLDAARSFEISADGPVSTTASAFTGVAEGYAYVFTNGRLSAQCRGRHRFSFDQQKVS